MVRRGRGGAEGGGEGQKGEGGVEGGWDGHGGWMSHYMQIYLSSIHSGRVP